MDNYLATEAVATSVATSLEESYETVIPPRWYNYGIPLTILAKVFGLSEPDYYLVSDECTYFHGLGLVETPEVPKINFKNLINSYLNLNSYCFEEQLEETNQEWRALKNKLGYEICQYTAKSMKPTIESWNKSFEVKRKHYKGYEKLVIHILRFKDLDFDEIARESTLELLDNGDFKPNTPMEMSNKVIGFIMTRICAGEWSLNLSDVERNKIDQLLVDKLTPIQKEIIDLSYGIGRYQLSMPKLPSLLNIPQPKIYRIKNQAITVLRKHLDANLKLMSSTDS